MDEISMISTTAILSLMIWKRSPAARAEKAKPTVLEAVAATNTAAKAIASGKSDDSSSGAGRVMRSPVTGMQLTRLRDLRFLNQLWRATVRCVVASRAGMDERAE